MLANTKDSKASVKVEFIQYHKPGLQDGDYCITVTQEISSSKIDPNAEFKSVKEFSVYGERFALKPADIGAVFPPAGSLGEHSNCLPHIILKRSTLPWEREAEKPATDTKGEETDTEGEDNGGGITWLALLLFDEKEKLGGTIDKEAFKSKFECSDFGESVWDHLLDPDIGWLKPIDNCDKAMIAAESSRKSGTLGSDFPGLENQVEAILDQFRTPRVVTLEELKAASRGWPGLDLERGQKPDDKVTVIDVKKGLLQKIMPTKKDLEYLAHVRQRSTFAFSIKYQDCKYQDCLDNKELCEELRQEFEKNGTPLSPNARVSVKESGSNWLITDEDNQKTYSIKKDKEYLKVSQVGDELAVVIGNRLPLRGGISIAHLVSVEGRYKDDGFDYQGANDEDYIRLVSLKSWRFACADKNESFKGLLENANRGTLRLPESDDTGAEAYLAMGYVPLPHCLRQGGKTFSWYHGPLVPGECPQKNDVKLPVRAADELVRYNPENGLFDVSYAAAWELGRLLALRSKHFSTSLYNWKHTHMQQALQTEKRRIHPHLVMPWSPTAASQQTELPEHISKWLENLSLFHGVPFNYLVPDELMLPIDLKKKEGSIRFFQVDPAWVKCLLDGAFSIGRAKQSHHKRDKCYHRRGLVAPKYEKVSGLLLRSDVVAGWPGLLVDAYDRIIAGDEFAPDCEKLKLLRMDRLSANVLLCLFEGEVKTVDIHQKPEGLHFGLDVPDTPDSPDTSEFYKDLRDENGEKSGKIPAECFPWKNECKRVIDISSLVCKIGCEVSENTFTAAQFAFQMIEGVEKVRFIKVDK